HPQRRPRPVAAGGGPPRRVQRLDPPARPRQRQAPVRAERQADRAEAPEVSPIKYRRRHERLRTRRRGPARLVRPGASERQGTRAAREMGFGRDIEMKRVIVVVLALGIAGGAVAESGPDLRSPHESGWTLLASNAD